MNAADLLSLAASYLLGAVPFGLLMGRLRGIDIRQHGSGNIGATNVLRVLGKPLGITTFIFDALKGFVPCFFFPGWFDPAIMSDPTVHAVSCGAAAILGHNFPVFLGFKGGKGVATSAGVLIGAAWQAALIGLGAWALVFFTTRYVSLASLLAAATVAVAGWLLYPDRHPALPIVLTILALLIILRHRANIGRLLAGTENRFVKKTRNPTPPASP
jgi:glycerol-3-phosphate acyltransferase PlsY